MRAHPTTLCSFGRGPGCSALTEVSGQLDTLTGMSPATATPSPYRLPLRRTPIVLRRGRLELRKQGQALRASGRIELELLPSLRFRFVMPSALASGRFLEESELYLPGLRASVPVFVTNAPVFGAGTVRGTVENASVGSSRDVIGVRFLVANLPDFFGGALEEAGEGTRSVWRPSRAHDRRLGDPPRRAPRVRICLCPTQRAGRLRDHAQARFGVAMARPLRQPTPPTCLMRWLAFSASPAAPGPRRSQRLVSMHRATLSGESGRRG